MEFRCILETLGIPGRSRLRRQRALIVTLAGVVVLIAWLVLVVHAEGPAMTMPARGVRASGVITEVSQSDAAQPGGAVDVGYLYKGRYFDGHVFLADDSPSYRIGQPVTVTVDPLHPQDVTVGGSDNLSPALVWMLVGLLLAGSLLVIYGVAFWVSGSSFARRRLRTRQFHASPRSTNW
jgi:hypothetical protein